MMFDIFLKIHIAAGVIGLSLGPISMFAPKRKGLHTRIGNIYHWLMFTVCISAVPLSILKWEKNWYLLLIAIFSYSFAFKGYHAAKNKRKDWLKKHITGMLGSYIAMTTALLVVNAQNIPGLNLLPNLLVWFIPTIVGTPLITMVQRKFKKS
tara:strand:- start:939 stop:1394 length:456 start_codon:yes stop_codon:yes gene_type:complete